MPATSMPTAARLAAAVFYAALAFISAELIKPLMPEGTQFGYFSFVCAGLGALTGWRVMGVLVGHTYRAALESGLRTMLAMVFWGVLLFGIYDMILQSMNLRYTGPVEALQAVFEISLNYLKVMANPGLIATLLMGGALGGVFAEWVSRRWP